MARIYANENFPLPVVQRLRELGHDVVTVAETGKAEQAWPDEEVLTFACEDERILLTLNRKHFIRLHREHPEHTGIVVCTFDAEFNSLAERIHNSLVDQANMRGTLIRVNRPSN